MESKKKSYIPDSRFALIAKEARIVSVFWLLYFAATMAACYFLGGGDPAEYSYILGFPSWFVACVLICVIGVVVAIYMLKRRFSDVSLDAKNPDYDYTKEEKE